jgi:hypothetical protein
MTNNLEHKKDGFVVKYRVGRNVNCTRFADTTIHHSIANIATFLIGCGFGRSAVVEALKDAAEQIK